MRYVCIQKGKDQKANTALAGQGQDVVSIKTDLVVLQWMVGLNLAMVTAIFVKTFFY